jgi:CRISPR/Cas system-associated endonuclease Cas1
MQHKKHIFIHTGSATELREKSLIIRSENLQIEEYPLHRILGIFAFGDIGFDRQVLISCLLNRIPVVFCDIQGLFIGRLEPSKLNQSDISREQAKLPAERQLSLSQNLVYAALEQRRRFLQRKAREGTNLRIFLEDLELILKRFDTRWPKQHSQSISELMGLYGVVWLFIGQLSQKFAITLISMMEDLDHLI